MALPRGSPRGGMGIASWHDMNPTILMKRSRSGSSPNLADWERACRECSFETLARELAGLPAGGLNLAYEAVHRHVGGPLAEAVAVRWLGKKDEVRELS